MIKRTPNRNARSKGFKAKHALQICLLLGVCFWLIYQVKHSHEKKKEFDEKDAKVSIRSQSGDDFSILGRKSLLPRVQETSKDDKHEEDDEEETTTEEEVNKNEENKLEQKQVENEIKREEEEREDGNNPEDKEEEEEEGEEGFKKEEAKEGEDGKKHEDEAREYEETKREEEEREKNEGNKPEDEEQEEEETKSEETEEEGRGGGDDEIDEHDQEKTEGEVDREDFVDDEKERILEGDEKESTNDEGENKESLIDNEASTEDRDHDGGVQHDHEAREVNYRADDASSAVTHDTPAISMDLEKGSSDSSDVNSVLNNSELEMNSDNHSGDQNNSTLPLKDGESDPSLNVTHGEDKGDEIINSEKLPNNATTDSQFNIQIEASNDTMNVNAEGGSNPADGSNESSGTTEKNETVETYDSNKSQNVTSGGDGETLSLKTTESEQVNNAVTSDGKELISNSNISDINANSDSLFGDSNNGSDTTVKPEVTAEVEVNTDSSSAKNETTDASQNENLIIESKSGETDESTDSSATDGDGTEVVHDPIDTSDSSIGQDEKEARIDLGTLPDNNSEAVNSRDAATE
ncbi:uncharacterized protein LOC126660581 isoform X2 [Mercurialis annua]|nr:uncharacterized protein LOC126660581 isoform X2 [Mercurialis annua]